jgi:hypothetical protein
MAHFLTFMALACVTAACSRSAPDLPSRAPPATPLAAAPAVAWQAPRMVPAARTTAMPTTESGGETPPPWPAMPTSTESGGETPPPWLAEMLDAPDPQVRLQGLDAWAQQPGDSLDPVTYALVDPDESVRARAQELFEQALARR